MEIPMLRKTKIIATVGPTSSSPEMLEQLIHTGVNVFRLNFSHGTHDDHAKVFETIRMLSKKNNKPIGILADLQGPKLRVGVFKDTKINLKDGQSFQLDMDKDTPGTVDRVSMPHPEIFKALKPGLELLLDDGKVRLKVITCNDNSAQTEVINGGDLSNRKGVNLPGAMLDLSPLTKKDRIDLDFALKLGVDWVALSFVQTAADIIEARDLIQNKAKIMAKIEKPQAVDNLESIVLESDGIMVARGDLGVEMPVEQVPCIQKRMIRLCRTHGKPLVVATQMLDSMVLAPTPTRAEASDVANAVYDGADAVMLSAESASGKYPLESVAVMGRIINQVESDPFKSSIPYDVPSTLNHALSSAAVKVTQTIPTSCLITFSDSGISPLCCAQQRPECNLVAITPVYQTACQLALVWGVNPFFVDGSSKDFTKMVDVGTQIANDNGFSKPNHSMVIVAAYAMSGNDRTTFLRIV
jgi:pyruvate kinase